MPTLQEILDQDLGLGTEQPRQEKVASQAESDEIEKLAAAIGLTEEPVKTASATEMKVAAPSEAQPVQSKEATAMMDVMYSQLFPEDAGISSAASQVKTAEEEKNAAYEAKLGARSFDKFASRWDVRIEKLAETMSGDAHVTASKDAEPVQTEPNNKNSFGGGARLIGTDPKVTDLVHAQKGKDVVGTEEQHALPEGATKAAAARKHMLLAQIDFGK